LSCLANSAKARAIKSRAAI
ncbi:hypothetical protein VCCP1035_1681B, partial [Vibrio cholerae CP1035(8)]